MKVLVTGIPLATQDPLQFGFPYNNGEHLVLQLLDQ